MNNCHTIDVLLSGYLDGELTQQDRQSVEIHLEECATCRSKYRDMAELRTAVSRLAFPSLADEQKETMMNAPLAGSSQRLGWLLIVTGILLGGGFLLWEAARELLKDPEVPDVFAIAMMAPYVGLTLLLLSALFHRLKARRTDRYKDVEL